jgi:hypothetical protein
MISYQCPDRGDKIEETLFPSLKASMLSTLVNAPVEGQRYQTQGLSDSDGRISGLSTLSQRGIRGLVRKVTVLNYF